MDLPASCAAAYLLRKTWAHSSPAGGPEKDSEMCLHGPQEGEWRPGSNEYDSPRPAGPSIKQNRIEGLMALLLNSLGGMVPTTLQPLPQHLSSRWPTQGN